MPKGSKLSIAFLVGALLAVAPGGAQQESPLVSLEGDAVPEETLGDEVIAVFFASWSPRCRDVVEQANQLHEKWGARARVTLVSFQERAAAVEEFLAGKSVRVDVVMDPQGTFAKKFGITTLPSLLVLQDGKAAYRGRFPSSPETVLAPLFD